MADSTKLVDGDRNSGGGVNISNETVVKINSPASESSGDTLHDDESSDIRSERDANHSLGSLTSPESLDFSNLTLDDPASRPFKSAIGRYTTPAQRGINKTYNNSPRFGYTTHDYSRRDGNFRSGSPFNGRGGAHRNSRTWMSPDAQNMQEFQMIRHSMRRQFKNADVSKWKFNDFIAHRQAVLASDANRLANKAKEKKDALLDRLSPISPETQQNLKKWGLLGNFNQQGNLSRVLGEETIWCADWLDGKDEIAPWPTMAEMKWEGDDRAKTGVGRFLPLPREDGPPGLAWNQLPCVEQYPMDQVARIPTMEDVYLPVDDQIEEDHEYLWSKNLEEAMDEVLDS